MVGISSKKPGIAFELKIIEEFFMTNIFLFVLLFTLDILFPNLFELSNNFGYFSFI